VNLLFTFLLLFLLRRMGNSGRSSEKIVGSLPVHPL